MTKTYQVFYIENGETFRIESDTFPNEFEDEVAAYVALRDSPSQVISHLKKTSEFIIQPVYEFK